jgi:bis(5'-adenosyl)-triphosphatase
MLARFFLCLFLLLALLTPTVSSMTTTSNSNTSPTIKDHSDSMRFGRFKIPSSHIFYQTKLSAAFVNLRPIVPGHVLIMPQRIVARMEDLSEDEYLDMWKSVRNVQKILTIQYHATAFNVAVQDGRAAGQSVPHVHVHILPRKAGDFERNDDVYDELEAWAPRADDDDVMPKQRTTIEVPKDEDRVDRTPEIMAEEAATYRNLLESLQNKL